MDYNASSIEWNNKVWLLRHVRPSWVTPYSSYNSLVLFINHHIFLQFLRPPIYIISYGLDLGMAGSSPLLSSYWYEPFYIQFHLCLISINLISFPLRRVIGLAMLGIIWLWLIVLSSLFLCTWWQSGFRWFHQIYLSISKARLVSIIA